MHNQLKRTTKSFFDVRCSATMWWAQKWHCRQRFAAVIDAGTQKAWLRYETESFSFTALDVDEEKRKKLRTAASWLRDSYSLRVVFQSWFERPAGPVTCCSGRSKRNGAIAKCLVYVTLEAEADRERARLLMKFRSSIARKKILCGREKSKGHSDELHTMHSDSIYDDWAEDSQWNSFNLLLAYLISCKFVRWECSLIVRERTSECFSSRIFLEKFRCIRDVKFPIQIHERLRSDDLICNIFAVRVVKVFFSKYSTRIDCKLYNLRSKRKKRLTQWQPHSSSPLSRETRDSSYPSSSELHL